MTSHLVPVLGLGGAASWGVGDFCGGLATRRAHAIAVLLASQAVGLAALVALAIALREPAPATREALIGGAAGLVGATGILLLYRGLSVGPMSLVAPLSGVLAAAIPIPFAIAAHGAAAPLQLVGMAAGLAGIWLVAGGGAAHVKANRRAFLLAAGSGLAFGLFYVLVDLATTTVAFWPLAAARVASVSVAGAILLARRIALPTGRSEWGLAALAGLLDASGNLLFALAAQAGRLDVAGLLVSLYPAFTVLLALVVLRERLTARQGVGIAAMVACIVLIASA